MTLSDCISFLVSSATIDITAVIMHLR